MLLHVLDGGPVTPADLWRRWRVEPAALALILIVAAAYTAGLRRLWIRARAHRVVSTNRAIAFYLGIATLLVALCSPLDALADTLFSAHMLQHVLLIAVAAPLLIAGIPAIPLVWSLPEVWRHRFGRAWNASGLGGLGHALTRPVPAWGLHTLALWAWHAPGPYGAALANPAIHALEHACFLGTALLVWQVALTPLGTRRDGSAWGLLVLFGTLFQSSALGALLTFATTPWYYAQSVGAGAWHLTALEDQQLAGIIMWIPASFIYVGAMLAVMRRWFDAPDGRVHLAVIPGSLDSRAVRVKSRASDPQVRDIAAYRHTLH